MTDETTPDGSSDSNIPSDPNTPNTPNDPNDPSEGWGLGSGIVVGACVGVVGAMLAVLWVGFRGPAVNTDTPGETDVTGLAGEIQPGSATAQRPATGSDILPPSKTGGGSLILQNVGDLDSVVILADETTYTRAVYVRSGERVTIPNVAAGTYEVLMMLGSNWNTGRFTGMPLYQSLDRPVEFTERDTGTSTEYTQLTVSIEPVGAGLVGMRATEPFQLTSQ
ncbi:MAG: hypothetical protein HOP16_05340 [Acidobacteria bacterium]|nr:hypothetical protein [Acidobacteriota bacterium]